MSTATHETIEPEPAPATTTAEPMPLVVRACPSCGQAIGAMLSTEVICPSPRRRP
jgi:hypothetical protein